MSYPVLEIIPALKRELIKSVVTILQAPPGAGKSTIVPLQLLTETWLDNKKIIMLEPRRLAARSVAMRMAFLQNEEVGQQVGYRVRFETKVSSQTRIEVITEGILTRLIQSDNALEGVGLVIFDEFHERSLQADLALALCLNVQQVLRPDMRILIMSATLDGQKISSRLNDAPILTSLGKQFPVEIKYVEEDPKQFIDAMMSRVIKKALRDETGDILAFFPGAGEIMRTKELLEADGVAASIHPLYGDLPFRKQQEALLPDAGGARKIVMATSIAETSLTIEGVRIVVDCGYSRVPAFDPLSGLNRLKTIRITKDSADQRTGRAGRLGPGVSYRLWSEGVNRNLVAHRVPEILEADLAPLVLELSAWGVTNVNELVWITPLPPGAINQAVELLQQLEALDDDKKITVWGKKIVQLPTHPRLAYMLLKSTDDDLILKLAIDIAALLEERDPLPKNSGADLSLRISTLRKWRSGERVAADTKNLERVERLAASWRNYFKVREDNSTIDDYKVGEMIVLAYPERIAKQTNKNKESYRLANSRPVKLPPNDPLLREPWLAVAHLDLGNKEGKIFLAAPVDERKLHVLAHEHEVVRWDKERGMVVGLLEKRVGNLVLESKQLQRIPAKKKLSVLCEVVQNEGLKMLGWEETHDHWQARILSLKKWRSDEQWPDVKEETLLANVSKWLTPYLEPVFKRSDLQRLDLTSILNGLIPWDLQSNLTKLAPEKLEVPSGSMIPIRYFQDGSQPVMEVRLQEVFGLLDTPTINVGKIKIVMHLLSPGYKPVQVTQDLKSFWQTTYHEVRKELRRRYPKHSWPEDPFTATAVRGAIKRRS